MCHDPNPDRCPERLEACTSAAQRCLTTWMPTPTDTRIGSLFLLGCPAVGKPELMGPHALVLPCPDDYASLPQRTRWFCRWALEEGAGERGSGLKRELSPPLPRPPSSVLHWDYLFKCDDDTYVSIPRLAVVRPGRAGLRGGRMEGGRGLRQRRGGIFSQPAGGGDCGREAVQSTGAEDLLVGQVLREAGIRCRSSRGWSLSVRWSIGQGGRTT